MVTRGLRAKEDLPRVTGQQWRLPETHVSVQERRPDPPPLHSTSLWLLHAPTPVHGLHNSDPCVQEVVMLLQQT